MEIHRLHLDAMRSAELALEARARGNSAAALEFGLGAFRFEHQAAMLAVEKSYPEPTRSVLLKSAAHLAVDIGQLRAAEQLVSMALAGEPPEDLAEELRSLFEEIGFDRHLDLRGVELQRNDLQMVMVGNAIAPGMVASDEFVNRVRTFQSLVYRTSESDRGLPYRERGDPKHDVERPLQLFVSVPRAASFAVSLKIARQKGQAEMRFAESAMVLDTVLTRLELFEQSAFGELQKQIPQREYFENFVDLASELAPDGRLVKMVGFTTGTGREERRLQLRRVVKHESKRPSFEPTGKRISITGKLFHFHENDAGQFTLKLRTDDGEEYKLRASNVMLDKALRYVGRKNMVKLTGVRTARMVFEFDAIRAVAARKGKR